MKLLAVLALVILAGIYYYVALPALNIHSTEFWIFLIVVIVAAAFFYAKRKRFDRYALKESKGMESDPGDSWRSCNRVCSRYTVVFSDRQREKISEADEGRAGKFYRRCRRAFL